MADYNREWYLANKDKKKQQAKNYYEANKSAILRKRKEKRLIIKAILEKTYK